MISAYGGHVRKAMNSGGDVPVFEVNPEVKRAYPNGDVLPGVWITRPVEDGGGKAQGRTYVTLYNPHDDTPDGEDALWFGSGYYEEAMGYTDAADRGKRIDCFRAAELLYRHAAGMGNHVADLCLGYVYSYDRCAGAYWESAPNANSAEGASALSRQARAYECFAAAAQAGIPEACYKFGDMLKRGEGCEPDAQAVFRWYARASELVKHENPVILGSIALRLGECYEEGLGCAQDFSRALQWYEQAEKALSVAVEAGESWYEKALSGARSGVKRCKQEV